MALQDIGISVVADLYHHDLPTSLQEAYGGWTDDTIIDDFNNYASVAFQEFGPYVSHWITIANPTDEVTSGYHFFSLLFSFWALSSIPSSR